MGMGEAVRLFFKNYVNFQGRSRRAEYWWPVLAEILLYIATLILIALFSALGDVGAVIVGFVIIIYLLICIALIIPGLSVTFRRLHDTNRSAWWILIALIPLIGSIILILFLATEGTSGPNQFGTDPKNRIQADVFA